MARAAVRHTLLISLAAVLSPIPGIQPGHAQTSRSATPKFTMQGAAEPSTSPVVRDATNRPCLDVEAAARASVVNRDLIDHVVSFKNNCPRLIKVKICYFQTDRCKDVAVAGYQRADTVLGTMVKVTTFRYSMTQK
jgi:hypothetical protein